MKLTITQMNKKHGISIELMVEDAKNRYLIAGMADIISDKSGVCMIDKNLYIEYIFKYGYMNRVDAVKAGFFKEATIKMEARMSEKNAFYKSMVGRKVKGKIEVNVYLYKDWHNKSIDITKREFLKYKKSKKSKKKNINDLIFFEKNWLSYGRWGQTNERFVVGGGNGII